MGLYYEMEKVLHKIWCQKLRRRLDNTNISIISNNCLGGFISHDLGLKFNSPTVNLTVQNFPLFVEHFEHYLKCDLIETDRKSEYSFPTGMLISEKFPPVNLLFNHYHSFEEAKAKWMERRVRVDYDNVFFIMECYDNYFPDEFEAYKRLPYRKNKAVLTHSPHPEMKDAYFISCDNDNSQKFVGGGTFKQRPFSGRRYLDDFDYVTFFNNGGNID